MSDLGKLRDAADRLRKMGDRAGDATPVWPKVGDVVAGTVAQQYQQLGTKFSAPWKPLSPPYLRWKIKNGLDPRIGRASGRLFDDVTSRPMGIEEYTPSTGTYGTRVETLDGRGAPYPKYMQEGTRFMAARPFLGLDSAAEADIGALLGRWVAEGRVGA